ncbi:MAG: FAD-dependent oxidoreductase [Chloroflexia bacterium]
MRYVIVGNGVAGTKAAEVIRKREAEAEITILSAERVAFYRRPALVDHLSGRVPLEELRGRPACFYEENRIDLRLGTTVTGLDTRSYHVETASGERIPYDRLLLAVGVAPERGHIPGDTLSGLLSLQRLEDLSTLRELAQGARQAVVVGEGIIGLEMARAFRELGLPVRYLISGPRFWSNLLSPDASAVIEERLAAQGVEVLPQAEVVAFLGSGSRVRAVETLRGERIPADLVGLSISMRPPLSWAQTAGLNVSGNRLPVSDRLATPLRDVYAAGDAVQIPGEGAPYGWLRAWHQGVVAGINLTGGNAPFRGRTIVLSTRVFGMPLLVMGELRPSASKVQRESGDYPLNGVYKELIIADGRLVGAVMIGDVSEAGRVEDLVRRKAPYDEIDPALLRALFDQRYWRSSGSEVLCPVCKFLLQVGEEALRAGELTCPICGAEFRLRLTGDRFLAVLE